MTRRQLIIALVAIAALTGCVKVPPAPLPPALLKAQIAKVENRSTDYDIVDYLYADLHKWDRWSLTEDQQRADLLIFFTVRDQNAGTLTTERTSGGVAVIGRGLVGGRNRVKVKTAYIQTTAYLTIFDPIGGKEELIFKCEPGRADRVAKNLIDQLRRRFPR